MTTFTEAEALERYYRALKAAAQEMDEATSAGLAWMAANDYRLPPAEMQARVKHAHAAWLAVQKQGLVGDLPVRNDAPDRE
jgi:hypothetical protein